MTHGAFIVGENLLACALDANTLFSLLDLVLKFPLHLSDILVEPRVDVRILFWLFLLGCDLLHELLIILHCLLSHHDRPFPLRLPMPLILLLVQSKYIPILTNLYLIKTLLLCDL